MTLPGRGLNSFNSSRSRSKSPASAADKDTSATALDNSDASACMEWEYQS